jgi:hypothetical protein
VEVLASNETFSAPMEETYKKLDIDPNSVTTLDAYLSEYYSQILKKLKEVGAQGRQTGAAVFPLLANSFCNSFCRCAGHASIAHEATSSDCHQSTDSCANVNVDLLAWQLRSLKYDSQPVCTADFYI